MLYQYVLGQGMDILNLSFTTSGLIKDYTEQDIRFNFGQTIAALAQTDAQDKTILVWAAGNANDRACTPRNSSIVTEVTEQILKEYPAGSLNADSPEIYAGMVARIEELQGHSIAVVCRGPGR